ncbi:glycoside hydrolase family 88/105 protein [Gracilibacillus alcaliphilus]|uniref:glycoside hydrolase family 88/105 protein n=1 Tax=Gracilibacillus alcaliphilus TaxID=1401441 RepID=UPI00195ECE4B|nr:glycoside hydrolase family 88 protein [Gracilibacillus alcaliphilus]MBM7679189.1 unsaturated rhamnogalacturonyl hydrolase [Gracilibacillus alcaliphilus]
MTVQQITALGWAKKACDTLMDTYQPVQLPPANRWHYHQGVFLCGVQDLYQLTGEERYYQYYKEYVDQLIDEEGNFYFARSELDAIQPGLLLLPLYEKTKARKYRAAASKLRYLLNTLNKTKEGGFWHKDKYPYQMWLDGLYMAGPFAIRYGQMFDEPELIELVIKQESLMRKHTQKENGLYYHGYDESKQTPWSTEKGHAPEVWGRALGWYAMVTVNFIEMLPSDHPKVEEWKEVVQQLIEALITFQDEETGLWYQVVDKPNEPNNYLESSCSCLFIYAIAKAVHKGYVNTAFLQKAEKGYRGLLEHKVAVDQAGQFKLHDICIGTSIGTYDYYVERETSTNDLHGVGAFVLASVQLAIGKGEV